MTVVVAVSDNRESRNAFIQAIAEARLLGTDLVAVNLGAKALSTEGTDTAGVQITVLDKGGSSDAADVVLNEIATRNAQRLVIGVKRRTPVGKVLLGSLSQKLLLSSPVPVLAVKTPEEEFQSSALSEMPGGIPRVTG
ncbi:universal stress protein [Gordonia iterans]|uniref:Universal stress protein n=1 Tax=Gordonia iterans TaxID=1004901 RepID=A0A2S0KBH4_9ACTN|nr:universal stress protein [Gordonia iterans]AVL99009.1 universal stress protein [Gordonia iterans]